MSVWVGANYLGIQRQSQPIKRDTRIEIGETDFGSFYFKCRKCNKGSWLSGSSIVHEEGCVSDDVEAGESKDLP